MATTPRGDTPAIAFDDRSRTGLARLRRAFTLVEVIVTVLVIALLAGIAAVAYSSVNRNTRNTAAAQELFQVGRATLTLAAKDEAVPATRGYVRTVLAEDDLLGPAPNGYALAGSDEVGMTTAPSTRWREISVGHDAGYDERTGLAMLSSAGDCVMAHLDPQMTVKHWVVKEDLGTNCAGDVAAATEANESPGAGRPLPKNPDPGDPGDPGGEDEDGDPSDSGDLDTTPPDAPKNVTVIPGLDHLDVSWVLPDADDVDMIVVVVTGPGGVEIPIDPLSGTSTSVHVPDLTPDTEYVVEVVAVDTSQNVSPSTDPVTVRTLIPAPAAPANLAADAGDASVALAWDPVDGVTSYKVYRSIEGSGAAPVVTTVTGTSLNVAGLTNDVTYEFSVSAVGPGGEGARSDAVEATPEKPAPGAPAGLKATAGNTQVVLTWTATAGATGYSVYQSTDGKTFTKIATPTAPTYTRTGLTNGTVYYFHVTATNTGGESPRSTIVSAKPMPPIPATPTGLKAVATPTPTAQLSWTAVPGADGYYVYRNSTVVATLGPVTTWTDTAVKDGDVHTWTVAAFNISGASAKSAGATVTFTPPTPTAAPGVQSFSGTAGGLWISWPRRAGSTVTVQQQKSGTTTWTTVATGETGSGAMVVAPQSPKTQHRFWYVSGSLKSAGVSPVSVAAAPGAFTVDASISGLSTTRPTIYVSWHTYHTAKSFVMYRGAGATVTEARNSMVRSVRSDTSTVASWAATSNAYCFQFEAWTGLNGTGTKLGTTNVSCASK